MSSRIRAKEISGHIFFCELCGHLNRAYRDGNTVTISRPPLPVTRFLFSMVGLCVSVIVAFVFLTINVAPVDLGGVVGTLVLAPGKTQSDAASVQEFFRVMGFVWMGIILFFLRKVGKIIQYSRYIGGVYINDDFRTPKPFIGLKKK